MNKVAIYLRCSTFQQNIQTQRQPILDFCRKNELAVLKEYCDEGISGTTSSRPKLDEMLRDFRTGQIDTLLIFRMDRLGRSLRNIIDILGEFRNRKVRLISISDGIDTQDDSPMSKAMWQLLGVFAELERSVIVERVRAGLDRARRQNIQLGRRKGSFDKKPRRRSGYFLRYAGKTKSERRLGKRINKNSLINPDLESSTMETSR